MVAAEEMGHKGLRAMRPLDTMLANALRVKLGRGRELPEEPKPKRAERPNAAPDSPATHGAPPTENAPARAKKPADVTLAGPPGGRPGGAPVPRDAAGAAPPRPAQPAASAPVPARPAGAVEARPAPPAEVKRELIRVPESVTVGELGEKMRRKSGEVIKALL